MDAPKVAADSKKGQSIYDWPFILERETRFELATFSLATRHSTTELLPHIASCYQLIPPSGDR